VSGDLHSYYVAGIYGTNDAGTTDLDVLKKFSVSNCNQSSTNGQTPGTPCNYAASTTTLSSSGAPTGGTVTTGTDSGTIASPNTGALTPFEVPTLMSVTSATTSAVWQGAISLPDIGNETVAMQTAAASGSNPTPGILVGIVPVQGATIASLAGGYTFVGIGTNPSGVAGDAGVLQGLLFDGTGKFAGTETTNTWNPTTMTGGIHPSPGVQPCPNGATANSGSSGLICGSYTVAADGTITLTFLSGAAGGYYAGDTFTGALNGTLIVLTNIAASGPRTLLVGVAQPTTSAGNQSCSNNPLLGPAFANGVYQSVTLSFNNSLIQQQIFNNSSSPYTFTQNGGTLNSGGTLSAYPSGDSAGYTIDDNCFITVARQTDSQGNIFEYSLGAVSTNGAVFVLTDLDTSGGGPQTVVGVRISNVVQLQ
jgi:hypothetical protein